MEKYIAFVTNDSTIDVRVRQAVGHRDWIQAEDIRAKMRSCSHGPRVMCWAMTMMLFNVWIFVDVMHRLACEVYGIQLAIELHSALTAMSKIPCAGLDRRNNEHRDEEAITEIG